MKSKEYTSQTGKLKNFKLFEETSQLNTNTSCKPSTLVFRTKRGKKAIEALRNLESLNNHSWYMELKKRSQRHPSDVALFYRGNKITFKEMFEKADLYAKSLSSYGIMKGDEIPACMTNSPEFVYLLLAANKIGAKVNLFGSHFDKNYIKEILESCTKKVFISTDDNYEMLKDVVSTIPYENKVLFSLADSLPEHPEKTDEYEPELKDYYNYPNKAKSFKLEDESIKLTSEFLNDGSRLNTSVADNNNLDTEFLVTYTSGSTKSGLPKQIIHTNRSLIVAGRFHDSELSGNPDIKGMRGLAHIHPESNTDVITCISDNLMQGWSVALEPEYDKDKALDYIILNKPTYLNATSSFLVQAAKDYLIKRKYHADGKGKKLGFLLGVFAVGERTSKGEEKFINRFLRESSAGSDFKFLGLSLPYAPLSIGGGDCEHGGIYYSLWKSLFEKINKLRLAKKEYGMMPVPYAQVAAFKVNENGVYEECNFNEVGLIAANSATTMSHYKNHPKETIDLIITDTNGRDWISSNVFGYIDELGGVHVKGRYDKKVYDDFPVHNYEIEEAVELDTKNILSSSVVYLNVNGETIPVINIEFQPFKQDTDADILKSVMLRCQDVLGVELAKKIVIRIIDNNTSFPLTGSGKRNYQALEDMGLNGVFRMKLDTLTEEKDKQTVKVLKK